MASIGRVYEPHNPDASVFATRRGPSFARPLSRFRATGSLKAEGYRHPHVASLMGLDRSAENEDELFNKDDKMVTNIAGTKTTSSTWGQRSSRDGEVAQDEMEGTIIVPITPNSLERGAPRRSAVIPAKVFIERKAARAWNVADKRED